jgi:hypothetical protein
VLRRLGHVAFRLLALDADVGNDARVGVLLEGRLKATGPDG